MRLTILYDNESKDGLGKRHDFSCLVESEKNILLDTGWDAHLPLSNMDKMGVKERVDKLGL